MKIALVGKGGSGKTTLASLFIRYLAAQGSRIVGIDADINQHLASALGMTKEHAAQIPPLGQHLDELKEYLRGNNPRIASADVMVKTTPPGRGSRLLQPFGGDPFHATFARQFEGALVMATGPFTEDDLGVACYHSKVGAVELYLNHLVDSPDEYVVVDMTAGADSFASGLFTRFDATFLVVEPTLKSVSVYQQYRDYAGDYGVNLWVVGNKIRSVKDVVFLQERVGKDQLITAVGDSDFVRSLDQGASPRFETIEPGVLVALQRMKDQVDAIPQDWLKFQNQASLFHLRNATAWANDRTGADLAQQIDPDFVMGPAALAE